MPFRAGAVGTLLLFLLTLGTVVVTASAVRPSPSQSPREASSSVSSAMRKSLSPRLTAAAEQARALADLGQRRSRNLLEIRSAQTRMNDALSAVDDLIAGQPIPPPLAPALDGYGASAATVREAMAEAQAGFVRFDWDRVAAAYEQMSAGATGLQRAADDIALEINATPLPASPR